MSKYQLGEKRKYGGNIHMRDEHEPGFIFAEPAQLDLNLNEGEAVEGILYDLHPAPAGGEPFAQVLQPQGSFDRFSAFIKALFRIEAQPVINVPQAHLNRLTPFLNPNAEGIAYHGDVINLANPEHEINLDEVPAEVKKKSRSSYNCCYGSRPMAEKKPNWGENVRARQSAAAGRSFAG